MERFTSEGVEVYGAHDNLEYFMFENNLCHECKFKEELGLRAARDISDLLVQVQPYINYEEKRMAEEAMKNTQSHKVNDNKRTTIRRIARASALGFLITHR